MDSLVLGSAGIALRGFKSLATRVVTNVATDAAKTVGVGLVKTIIGDSDEKFGLNRVTNFNRYDVAKNQSALCGYYNGGRMHAENKIVETSKFWATYADSIQYSSLILFKSKFLNEAINEALEKLNNNINEVDELNIIRSIVNGYQQMVTQVADEIWGVDSVGRFDSTKLSPQDLQGLVDGFKKTASLSGRIKLLKDTCVARQEEPSIISPVASNTSQSNLTSTQKGNKPNIDLICKPATPQDKVNYIMEMFCLEASIEMLERQSNRDMLLNYYIYGVVELPKLVGQELTEDELKRQQTMAAAKTIAFFDSIPSEKLRNYLLAAPLHRRKADLWSNQIFGCSLPELQSVYLTNTQVDVLSKIVFRDDNSTGIHAYLDKYMERTLAKYFTVSGEFRLLTGGVNGTADEHAKYIMVNHGVGDSSASKGIVFTLKHIARFKSKLSGIDASSSFKGKFRNEVEKKITFNGKEIAIQNLKKQAKFYAELSGGKSDDGQIMAKGTNSFKNTVDIAKAYRSMSQFEDVTALSTVFNNGARVKQVAGLCQNVCDETSTMIKALNGEIEALANSYEESKIFLNTSGTIVQICNEYYRDRLNNSQNNLNPQSNLDNFLDRSSILGDAQKKLNNDDYGIFREGVKKFIQSSNIGGLYDYFYSTSNSDETLPVQTITDLNQMQTPGVYRFNDQYYTKASASGGGKLIEFDVNILAFMKPDASVIKISDLRRGTLESKSKLELLITLAQIVAHKKIEGLNLNQNKILEHKQTVVASNTELQAKAAVINTSVESLRAIFSLGTSNSPSLNLNDPAKTEAFIKDICQKIKDGTYENNSTLTDGGFLFNYINEKESTPDEYNTVAAKIANCILNYMGVSGSSISIEKLKDNQITGLKNLVTAIKEYIGAENRFCSEISGLATALHDVNENNEKAKKSFEVVRDSTAFVSTSLTGTLEQTLNCSKVILDILNRQAKKGKKNETVKDFLEQIFVKKNQESQQTVVADLIPLGKLYHTAAELVDAYDQADEKRKTDVSKIISSMNAHINSDENNQTQPDIQLILKALSKEFRGISTSPVNEFQIQKASEQINKLNQRAMIKELRVKALSNLAQACYIMIAGTRIQFTPNAGSGLYSVIDNTSGNLTSSTLPCYFLKTNGELSTEGEDVNTKFSDGMHKVILGGEYSIYLQILNGSAHQISLKENREFQEVSANVFNKVIDGYDFLNIGGVILNSGAKIVSSHTINEDSKVGYLMQNGEIEDSPNEARTFKGVYKIKSETEQGADIYIEIQGANSGRQVHMTQSICNALFDDVRSTITSNELDKLIKNLVPTLKNLNLLFGAVNSSVVERYFTTIKGNIETLSNSVFGKVAEYVESLDGLSQSRLKAQIDDTATTHITLLTAKNEQLTEELRILNKAIIDSNQTYNNDIIIDINKESLHENITKLRERCNAISKQIEENSTLSSDYERLKDQKNLKDVVKQAVSNACMRFIIGLLRSDDDNDAIKQYLTPDKLTVFLNRAFKRKYTNTDKVLDLFKSFFGLDIHLLRSEINSNVKSELGKAVRKLGNKDRYSFSNKTEAAAEARTSEEYEKAKQENKPFIYHRDDGRKFQCYGEYMHEIKSADVSDSASCWLESSSLELLAQNIQTISNLKKASDLKVAAKQKADAINDYNQAFEVAEKVSKEDVREGIEFDPLLFTAGTDGFIKYGSANYQWKNSPIQAKDITSNIRYPLSFLEESLTSLNDDTAPFASYTGRLQSVLEQFKNVLKDIKSEGENYTEKATAKEVKNKAEECNKIVAAYRKSLEEVKNEIKDEIRAESLNQIQNQEIRSKLIMLEDLNHNSDKLKIITKDVPYEIPEPNKNMYSYIERSEDLLGKRVYKQVIKIKSNNASNEYAEFSVNLTLKSQSDEFANSLANSEITQGEASSLFYGYFPLSLKEFFQKITVDGLSITKDINSRNLKADSEWIARNLIAKQLSAFSDSEFKMLILQKCTLSVKNQGLLETYRQWLMVFNCLAGSINTILNEIELVLKDTSSDELSDQKAKILNNLREWRGNYQGYDQFQFQQEITSQLFERLIAQKNAFMQASAQNLARFKQEIDDGFKDLEGNQIRNVSLNVGATVLRANINPANTFPITRNNPGTNSLTNNDVYGNSLANSSPLVDRMNNEERAALGTRRSISNSQKVTSGHQNSASNHNLARSSLSAPNVNSSKQLVDSSIQYDKVAKNVDKIIESLNNDVKPLASKLKLDTDGDFVPALNKIVKSWEENKEAKDKHLNSSKDGGKLLLSLIEKANALKDLYEIKKKYELEKTIDMAQLVRYKQIEEEVAVDIINKTERVEIALPEAGTKDPSINRMVFERLSKTFIDHRGFLGLFTYISTQAGSVENTLSFDMSHYETMLSEVYGWLITKSQIKQIIDECDRGNLSYSNRVEILTRVLTLIAIQLQVPDAMGEKNSDNRSIEAIRADIVFNKAMNLFKDVISTGEVKSSIALRQDSTKINAQRALILVANITHALLAQSATGQISQEFQADSRANSPNMNFFTQLSRDTDLLKLLSASFNKPTVVTQNEYDKKKNPQIIGGEKHSSNAHNRHFPQIIPA